MLPGQGKNTFQLEGSVEQPSSQPDIKGPQVSAEMAVGKGEEAGSGSDGTELTAQAWGERGRAHGLGSTREHLHNETRARAECCAPGRLGGVQPEFSVHLEALWAKKNPPRALLFIASSHLASAGIDLRQRA